MVRTVLGHAALRRTAGSVLHLCPEHRQALSDHQRRRDRERSERPVLLVAAVWLRRTRRAAGRGRIFDTVVRHPYGDNNAERPYEMHPGRTSSARGLEQVRWCNRGRRSASAGADRRAAIGVSGYRIYRNGAVVGTTSGRSYIESSITAAAAYRYPVRGFDAAGQPGRPRTPRSSPRRRSPPPPPPHVDRGVQTPLCPHELEGQPAHTGPRSPGAACVRTGRRAGR